MKRGAILMITSLPITILSVLPNTISGLVLETTARKRLGKKSFIQKKEGGTIQEITSPEELKAIACSYHGRIPGSSNYFRGWQHWKTMAMESIRYDLSCHLPHPANKTQFENLFFRLGVAADVGEMPSFSDPGARSGYALEFFCRARNLADLFLDVLDPSFTFSQGWIGSMQESPMLAAKNIDEPYEIVSLGGGPGFDFVGAAMAASFATHTFFGDEADESIRPIKASIFDYEEGWGDLVQAMDTSTRRVLQQSASLSSCSWGGKCDITKSLVEDPSNVGCWELVKSTDLWTCQYCVAENAMRLRDSDYIFFRELFQYAKEGSVFILTETHPRVWPDFHKLMKEHCPYMEIGFHKNGKQMLLRKSNNTKQEAPVISEHDLELMNKFESIRQDQERKIKSGRWERQERKYRE